jgi:hypothetical protein
MIIALMFCAVITALFLKSIYPADQWRYRILTLLLLTFFFFGYFWLYHAGQWMQYRQFLMLSPQSSEEALLKDELVKRHLKKLQKQAPSSENLMHLFEVCVQSNDAACVKSSVVDLIDQGIIPDEAGLNLVRAEYHLHHEKISEPMILALKICEKQKTNWLECQGFHARALYNSGLFKEAKTIWQTLLKRQDALSEKKQIWAKAVKQCEQMLAKAGGKSS